MPRGGMTCRMSTRKWWSCTALMRHFQLPSFVKLADGTPVCPRRRWAALKTAMCAFRLRQRFPDHHFYAARPAHLILDQDRRDAAVSIKSHLLRPYRRGPFIYAFHVKNGLVPPFFPFPPLMLFILLAYVVVAGILLPPLTFLLPLLIVLLPQLCYGWWIKRAIVEGRPIYLLFPYLQATEETMVLVGLLRGYLLFRRMRDVTTVKSEESSDGKRGIDSILR